MKGVPLQVLFVLGVLCLAPLAGGQPKAPLKCSTECNRFTPEIAAKRIRSYRQTEPHCTKQAIILITLKSIEICADPNADWVKKIMEKLNQKKATTSPVAHDATPVVAPEGPGVFQKHVGLTVTAPSPATAPTSFFQGTGTSPAAMKDTTQLPAGSSAMARDVAAFSEVIPEANRDSLKPPAPSITFAAGMVSSQLPPYLTAPVHGFDNTVGSREEPAGHTANAMSDVGDKTTPGSNSDPMAITKGSDHPVLPTNEFLDPTSARANAPDTASSSFSSDLPSILDTMEITTVTATPVPPDTTSVSVLKSTTTIDKGPSLHISKVTSSSAFGTRTFDGSSPVGKQEPSDTLVFTSQAFSGQARMQMTTERPNDQPLPSFLSRSHMHFVIPVSVVSGLMACSVAGVWLYLKFGVKTEDMSREMVQGLLYQKKGHQNNAYPMEVI